MIERTFIDIPDGKVTEADDQSFLIGLGWSRGDTWDDLLQSKRVLIISEAGAGKTHECRKQSQRLWSSGGAAFFIELSALATEDLCSLLEPEEEDRLNTWCVSQSEIATFFLDSFDELQLTMGSFERALKRLKRSLKGQLHRARIVITTRPIPLDEQLVRNILPIPKAPSAESHEEEFAKLAMGESREQLDNTGQNNIPDWRTVALMPLSDVQIVDFCKAQDVRDPERLFEDLTRRNALEFARRPQDLIELCADWREHKRIRTHQEQVATNVRVKLSPREERSEPSDLSVDKAIEGASRLALALLMTRRLTIRHSAASDTVNGEAALDPAVILSDWHVNERKALLERALFGFASYGRVRFHHRSVAEYLAAMRLITLRKQGMSFKALKRLIFAETKGKMIVRPSKRGMAGWLALQENGVFELLRDNEPAVLLNEGDPESLTQAQRNQALNAYVARFGLGGWRGLHVPLIQAHRFASVELAVEIERSWRKGVENPDVRAVLIRLIEVGKIKACADIVFDITQNAKANIVERLMAIEALIALADERLEIISSDIADADDRWPDRLSRGALIRLFPQYMSVEKLCKALGWLKSDERIGGDLNWQLPRIIAASELDRASLEELRDGLLTLISEDLKWQEKWPHIVCERAYLSGALAATSELGLNVEINEYWLRSCVISLRVHQREHSSDEPIKSLRKRLNDLAAPDNARLFWVEDSLMQSLREVSDPWRRFAEVTLHDGVVQLKPERDLAWINQAIGDTRRLTSERTMLLEAALYLGPYKESKEEYIERLCCLIEGEPLLIERFNNWLKPSKQSKTLRRWQKEQAKRNQQEERRRAKYHASWIQFRREVATRADKMFSADQSWSTAWNLWCVMRHDNDNSHSAGWNRRLIEKQFDKKTADRLQRTMMKIWRDEYPTFPSERHENDRQTYLVRWQLGLAAVYAEAEERNWAEKLSNDEAQLALRFSLIELNGLPYWIEDLSVIHPNAVDKTLGNELSWELSQPAGNHGYSNVLSRIAHMSEHVARLFLPRLESWLDNGGDHVNDPNNLMGMTERARLVTKAILKYGDVASLGSLRLWANKRLSQKLPLDLRLVWLSILLQVEPAEGVETLTNELATIEPSERSEAVTVLANLFGDRSDGVRLDNEHFSPQLLVRLTRLVYRHVRIEDDAYHEGAYTPDIRDGAEHARNNIVTALLNAKGEEGLAAKLEIAEDESCTHFNDRIVAVAEERWAHEIDAELFDDTQASKLDRCGEAPASTNEAMFALLKDRLFDLDELLLLDESPREAWALISEERVMRRVIARELRIAANSLYTVDQEAVTADEKETDIRLRSALSMHEAVVELKLGNANRSAKELLDTIESQLARKYLAAENCRAGALLITLTKDRKWKHPEEKRMINAEELLSLLKAEATRVQEALGGNTYIHVHLLDLRPRLPTEAQVN